MSKNSKCVLLTSEALFTHLFSLCNSLRNCICNVCTSGLCPPNIYIFDASVHSLEVTVISVCLVYACACLCVCALQNIKADVYLFKCITDIMLGESQSKPLMFKANGFTVDVMNKIFQTLNKMCFSPL